MTIGLNGYDREGTSAPSTSPRLVEQCGPVVLASAIVRMAVSEGELLGGVTSELECAGLAFRWRSGRYTDEVAA